MAGAEIQVAFVTTGVPNDGCGRGKSVSKCPVYADFGIVRTRVNDGWSAIDRRLPDIPAALVSHVQGRAIPPISGRRQNLIGSWRGPRTVPSIISQGRRD